MNRRGVLCEEVYHVLQFPSPALSVSGNMGIISACGTFHVQNAASTPLYSECKGTEKTGRYQMAGRDDDFLHFLIKR